MTERAWRWTGVDTRLSGSKPRGRTGHTLTPVPQLNALFLFGGYGDVGALADLWQFQPRETGQSSWKSSTQGVWTELSLSVISPLPRVGHSAICLGSDFYIFGGLVAYSYNVKAASILATADVLDDQKESLPESFNRATQNSDARFHLCFAQRRSTDCSFFDVDDPRYLSDVWHYDAIRHDWRSIVVGTKSELKGLYPVVFEHPQLGVAKPMKPNRPVRAPLYLSDGSDHDDDNGTSTSAPCEWPREEPPRSRLGKEVPHGSEIPLSPRFPAASYNDVRAEFPMSLEEEEGDAPSGRWMHQAVVFDHKMFVFGGRGNPHNQPLKDLWFFCLKQHRWHRIDINGLPSNLTEHLWFV